MLLSDNQRFSVVFKGYEKGIIGETWINLISQLKIKIKTMPFYQATKKTCWTLALVPLPKAASPLKLISFQKIFIAILYFFLKNSWLSKNRCF